jgi:hypothetical protein
MNVQLLLRGAGPGLPCTNGSSRIVPFLNFGG